MSCFSTETGDAMTKNRVTPIEVARFRYGLLFPILSKGLNLARGEQEQLLNEISSTPVTLPGKDYPVRISKRTLARWLAEVRKYESADEPARCLLRRPRSDRGEVKTLTDEQKKWLTENREQYPRWTYRLHADNLFHTPLTPKVSRSTVYRWMKSQGFGPALLSGGIRRKKSTLLFESEYPGELVHFDFHTSTTLRVLGSDGCWVKPKCVAFIDDRTRFCLHMQWFISETASDLVHAKIQSYLKYGISRRDMSDNGSAMISAEYERGLRLLGVGHEKTVPRSPYQNGKIESFWKPVEGRLIAMLSKAHPMTLEFLNEASVAWQEHDYNSKVHSETKAVPRDLWFSSENVARRSSPDADALRRAFRRRATRKQRHEDHTISLEGIRYQLPDLVWSKDTITVAYATWNRDLVTIIDPETEAELADIFPVDRIENGRRRRTPEAVTTEEASSESQSPSETTQSDLPPYLAHMINAQRKKWGLAGVLPKPELRPFNERADSQSEVKP
jgi:transposase InsO family protein